MALQRVHRIFFGILMVVMAMVMGGCAHQTVEDTSPQETFLVTVVSADASQLQGIAQTLGQEYALTLKNDWPLVSIDIHCFIFQTAKTRDLNDLFHRLRIDPRVDSVQPIHQYDLLASTTDDQSDLQYAVKAIKADRVHPWVTGRGVTVGVIDTGVDVAHSDLAGRVTLSKNFVGKTTDEAYAEVHGTAVAGVIAARADNGQGIVGVAPEANIVALRGCWQSEHSQKGQCNSLSLAKAIDYAVTHNIHILNLSLQGPHDPIIERLLERALKQGTVVVAAFDTNPAMGFPASMAEVIAVAAVSDHIDEGPMKRKLVAAPGVDILTTVPQGQYDLLRGSSLAAAHVTGLVALLRQQNTRMTSGEIAALLHASAWEGSQLGVVDACKALSLNC